MSSLANRIEAYIKRLLAASPTPHWFFKGRSLPSGFDACLPDIICFQPALRQNLISGGKQEGRRFYQNQALDLKPDKVVQIMEMLCELNREVNKDEALGFCHLFNGIPADYATENRLMKAVLNSSFR